MVVLKPVTRAIADGDRIHAIIRATAVNQDGRTTTITVPSMDAQMAMLREACRRAAIAPVQVNYVEAHGTGTAVGDPIEADAIGRVFGKSSGKNKTCVIGSIKSNIGHLEPAAGIAGLIKARCASSTARCRRTCTSSKPNPNIPFEELGLRVSNSLGPFPGEGAARIAAVNSFGFGGTNACAIVQQPPARVPVQAAQSVEGDFPLALPLVGAEPRLARSATRAISPKRSKAASWRLRTSPARWRCATRISSMASSCWPISAEQAAACFRSFERKEPRAGVISGRRGDAAAHDVRVHRTGRALVGDGTRPAQWRSGVPPQDRGVQRDFPRPVRLVADQRIEGDAGALADRSDVCDAADARSRCRSASRRAGRRGASSPRRPSATASARWRRCTSPARSRSRTASRSSITAAACRSSRVCRAAWRRSACPRTRRKSCSTRWRSISRSQRSTAPNWSRSPARRSEVERLIEELKLARSDVFARLLHIDYAFHSKQMDPFEAELRASLKGMTSREPAVPAYSTVTGKLIEAGELDADYWWRNMRCAGAVPSGGGSGDRRRLQHVRRAWRASGADRSGARLPCPLRAVRAPSSARCTGRRRIATTSRVRSPTCIWRASPWTGRASRRRTGISSSCRGSASTARRSGRNPKSRGRRASPRRCIRCSAIASAAPFRPGRRTSAPRRRRSWSITSSTAARCSRPRATSN